MAQTATLIETNSEKVAAYFSCGDSARAAMKIFAGEKDGTRMVLFGDCGLAAYQVRDGRVVRHEGRVAVDWNQPGETVNGN